MFLASSGPFLYDTSLTPCTAHVPVILLILKDEMVDASNSPEWPLVGVGLREVSYKTFAGVLFKGAGHFYIMYL